MALTLNQIVEQRRRGGGLYSRANPGTRSTSRQNASQAREFTQGINPQQRLQNRASVGDVGDPMVDNATSRAVRRNLDRQQDIQQDLSMGGMNPVEYRANLQRLQATNQGLEPILNSRTDQNVTEMQEVGATDRSLVQFDQQQMQGAQTLANTDLEGRLQERLARVEGGFGLDEALLRGSAQQQAAETRALGNVEAARAENTPSALERMRMQFINQGVQEGAIGTGDALNNLVGEPLDTGPADLVPMIDPNSGTEIRVPRGLAEGYATQRLAQTEEGQSVLGGMDPQGTAQGWLQNYQQQQQQDQQPEQDAESRSVLPSAEGAQGLIGVGARMAEALFSSGYGTGGLFAGNDNNQNSKTRNRNRQNRSQRGNRQGSNPQRRPTATQ